MSEKRSVTIILSPILVLSFLGLLLHPAAAPAKDAMGKAAPSREKTILVDPIDRSVSILAEVNGKYLYQKTRHGVVYSGGSNGNKSVFRSYATDQDFYHALMKLGLKAGNNMTKENGPYTSVQGALLYVTVTWEGTEKEYSLDEVIIDSNGKPFQIRFGGNQVHALKFKTGCIMCLDSCPVGITSNANYTYGAVEMRNEVTFRGNAAVLPKDGSPVIIKVKAWE